MHHSLKALLYCVVIMVLFSACSATESTSSTESASDSGTPGWFRASDFRSDSLSFYGYAQAVSTDSVIAVANATLQAKSVLETSLAEHMEDIRLELEEAGETSVTENDFLITLRNAHVLAQETSTKVNGVAVEKGGYFLGYSEAQISKKDFRDMMSNGFGNKTSYKTVFLESAAFGDFVK